MNHLVEFEIPKREEEIYVRSKTRNGKLAKYSELMFYFEKENGSIVTDEIVEGNMGEEVEVNGEYVKIPDEAEKVRVEHDDENDLQVRTKYVFE